MTRLGQGKNEVRLVSETFALRGALQQTLAGRLLLIPEGKEYLDDIGVELIQGLTSQRRARADVREIVIVDRKQGIRNVRRASLDKAPALWLTEELVARPEFERLTR